MKGTSTLGRDNLPAFPQPDSTDEAPVSYTGLTKREYFIAAAMQGILASESGAASERRAPLWVVAGAAIQYADATLAEAAK
jgi:hypothetical protein